MPEYSDIKTNKFRHSLKKLQNIAGIEVGCGGKHNTKVKCIFTGKSYPIPTSHKIVNKFIVKDFMEWLVKSKVCTKKEFDKIFK